MEDAFGGLQRRFHVRAALFLCVVILVVLRSFSGNEGELESLIVAIDTDGVGGGGKGIREVTQQGPEAQGNSTNRDQPPASSQQHDEEKGKDKGQTDTEIGTSRKVNDGMVEVVPKSEIRPSTPTSRRQPVLPHQPSKHPSSNPYPLFSPAAPSSKSGVPVSSPSLTLSPSSTSSVPSSSPSLASSPSSSSEVPASSPSSTSSPSSPASLSPSPLPSKNQTTKNYIIVPGSGMREAFKAVKSVINKIWKRVGNSYPDVRQPTRCAYGYSNERNKEASSWFFGNDGSNVTQHHLQSSRGRGGGGRDWLTGAELHGLVDDIVIVNLRRRPERRRYIKRMMFHLGVAEQRYRFFDAFDVREWGIPAFQKRARDVFGRSPESLLDPRDIDNSIKGWDKDACCHRRLVNSQYRCDVKNCGLIASGMSHLGAIKTWLDDVGADSNKSLLVMEDDVCPSNFLFDQSDSSITTRQLIPPPEGWKLLRLQDCSRYKKADDAMCGGGAKSIGSDGRTDCNGVNRWRLARNIREMRLGPECVSSYIIAAAGAADLFRSKDSTIRLAQEYEPWGLSPIEDTFNTLIFSLWGNVSYQMQNEYFGQTEGLDADDMESGSDNHPDSIVLGGH